MQRSILRGFITYASLNAAGMLGLSCYILADTFFVSLALGAEGLAALNLAIPIYSFLNGSGLMVGMGGSTKYAIQKSQGDHAGADRTFTHACCLAGALAVLFVLAGIFFPGAIVALFGGEGAVYTMSRTYLRVLLLFAPAFLANNLLLCFVRNDGAPQLAMAAMLTGSFSNVVLDWVFLFPCGMGIFGAVFATGLAPLISILVLSPHFFRRKNQFHLTRCPLEGKRAAGILSSGAPSLVTEVSSGVVMIVFNSILLSQAGNVGVAAYGVIANLSLVVISLYTGIAQGIQPIISRSHGVGDRAAVRATLRYALVTVLALSLLLYAIIFFGASPIAGIFNSEGDPMLQRIAAWGLKLYFLACPFAGCNIVLAQYFTAREQPRPAQAISLLRGFFLILPLAFLFSWLGGLTGTWCAFPAAEALVAALGLWLLLAGAKKEGAL